MIRALVLMVVLLGSCVASELSAAIDDVPEAEQIKERLRDYYYDGVQNNDVGLIRKIFHNDCMLLHIRDGEMEKIDQEKFRSSFSPEREAQKWDFEVISVDVTGFAAAAKIRLESASVRYTDYLNLLKIGDEWWIVNKIFVAEKK